VNNVTQIDISKLTQTDFPLNSNNMSQNDYTQVRMQVMFGISGRLSTLQRELIEQLTTLLWRGRSNSTKFSDRYRTVEKCALLEVRT